MGLSVQALLYLVTTAGMQTRPSVSCLCKQSSCSPLLRTVPAGAVVIAQQASVPSPGGSLASAPAPGAPGDYTVTSGLYTYTLTPSVAVGDFTRRSQSFFSGNNGFLASVSCQTF